MNHKRGVVALLVAFVFVFFFDFAWHGMLMKDAYAQIADHWRAKTDLRNHFGVLLLGQAVMAFAFTGLYVSKVGRQSPGAGFGYGIVIGLLFAGAGLVRFAAEPLTTRIICLWIIGGLIEFAILGALVGAIYKPKVI